MARLRVSQHSGREGSGRHNDRSFLEEWSDEKRRERAPHIRTEETQHNLTWSRNPGVDFKTAEIEFYKDRYSAALEKTNARYRHEGHSDRCKSVVDLYTSKFTRPEEMILQIGDKDSGITREQFVKCLNGYLDWLYRWNREHGSHMQVLDIAVHFDETSPHAHIRRIWDYQDKDGLFRVGQNKALEQAGIGLPDPEKKPGRYNNRKMTFDAMSRERWQEICKAQGIEVETQPRPSMRHKDKADYISGQLTAQILDLQEQVSRAQQLIQRADGLESKIRALEAQERVLSAAEVDSAAKGAKSPLFRPNKVIVPRKDFEKLVSTAHGYEEASAQAQYVLREQESILAEAQRVLDEAEQVRSRAYEKEHTIDFDRAMEVADLKVQLSGYKQLESRFPDTFKRLRAADRAQEQFRNRQERQEQDFSEPDWS